MEKVKQRKFFDSKRLARILPSGILAVAISFMIFIVSPLDIYAGNLSEFRFEFSDILGWLSLATILLTVVIFSLLFFTPIAVNRVLYGIFTAILLLLFLQGNYLNFGITSLSGDEGSGINISMSIKILDTAIWLIFIGVLVVLMLFVRKGGVARAVAFFMSAILLIVALLTTTVNGITVLSEKTDSFEQRKIESGDANYKPSFLTYKNLNKVSKNKNIIIFVVDRFDACEYAEKAFNEYPEIYSELKGFTYFGDNISIYGHTYPSVAYMLTRVFHEDNETRAEYFKRAYTQNETLKTLAENDYSVNIYTDFYYSYDDAYYFPEYIDNVVSTNAENVYKKVDQPLFLSARMTQIGLFRTMPIVFKDKVGGGINSNTCNGLVSYHAKELNDTPEYSTDMKDLYGVVSQGLSLRDDERNNFSFIHFTGCHNVEYNEQWKPAKGKDAKNMNISVKNSFSIINAYIKEMKRLGVYDDATIIITGDHAHVQPKIDYNKIDGPKLTALFVKPSGKGENDGQIKSSNAQVSHENLWATVFKSEGIAFDSAVYGKSVFDISEGEQPTRIYLWDYHDYAYTKYTECKYIIKGKGKDFENWGLNEQDVKVISRDLYE